MKMLILTGLMAFSFSSLAASVKITSFTYVRTSGDAYRAPLAELCGVVEGGSEMNLVRLSVDPKNKPAYYNTVAGKDGKFCLAVITYTGTAEAEVSGATAQAIIK